MKPLRHIWIFGAIFAVVCGLRIGWAGHYSRNLLRAVEDATAKRSREIEIAWQHRIYSNFLADEIVKAAWRTTPLKELSKVQQTTLRMRLGEVLHYLGAPSPEEYYRLKTEGFHWTFVPGARAKALLAAGPGGGVTGPPPDTKEVVNLMWEKAYAGASPCPQKLTAVCLDSVLGAMAHTNSPVSLLTGPVKNGFTASYDAIDPGFAYSGAKNSDDQPLLFEVSFLAKASGADSAGPVYITLRWINDDQNWALNRLMTDVWLHIKTIF